MSQWRSSRATASSGGGCAKPCEPRPLSRALARLSVGRGGPRDLANLRDGINAARTLRDGLAKIAVTGEAAGALDIIVQGIAAVSRLSDRLGLLLVDAAALSHPR